MNHLGLFAKFWQPGTVKTRLAATIGDLKACKLYHAFVFHLLKQLADSGDTRSVVFSPPEKEPDFRREVPNQWNLFPQSDGDLGVRMQTFFESRFQAMALADKENQAKNKIVVIGADCPQLGPELIENTLTELDKSSVVIGPSTDGGYYLIAMRDQCYDIFSDINWSTDQVLSQTLERLDNQNVSYHLLPALTDVDDIDSLRELENVMQVRQSQIETSHPDSTQTHFSDADEKLLVQITQASNEAKR